MPRIIDVGTGSGVIALTIAAKLVTAVVEAVDLSDAALALARENAERQGLAERVNFFKSDLLENAPGPYDIIVANLPYIATDAIPKLSREVQCDPVMALDGGGDGLEIISRLIVSAKSRLAPGGLLALEIGHDQSEVLMAQMERENYQDIQCKSDYQGVLRFLMAKYG
jgi:release factor glutamine methyltransferase